jgi:8-oxo-dGTP pyrophosphatase MutT (NUDIX family)
MRSTSRLIAEEPALTRLTDPDTFVGTSLVLPQAGVFLFGMRPLRTSVVGPILEITGIGGALEDYDSTLEDGARREALEEIGCDIRLIPSSDTLLIRGPGTIQHISVVLAPRPAAIVLRNFRTPPHEPWHEYHKDQSCLFVFLAQLLGDPKPSAELPGLIWLNPMQLVELARRDLPFRELEETGARLQWLGCPDTPEATMARLTDSQEALILALGASAHRFYHDLAEASGK